MKKWYSSSVSFRSHWVHIRSFLGIFLWRPVSIFNWWDDNLILAPIFLVFTQFIFTKYCESPKLVFKTLKSDNEDLESMSCLQSFTYTSNTLKRKTGSKTFMSTEDGYNQTSLKPAFCNNCFTLEVQLIILQSLVASFLRYSWTVLKIQLLFF